MVAQGPPQPEGHSQERSHHIPFFQLVFYIKLKVAVAKKQVGSMGTIIYKEFYSR